MAKLCHALSKEVAETVFGTNTDHAAIVAPASARGGSKALYGAPLVVDNIMVRDPEVDLLGVMLAGWCWRGC